MYTKSLAIAGSTGLIAATFLFASPSGGQDGAPITVTEVAPAGSNVEVSSGPSDCNDEQVGVPQQIALELTNAGGDVLAHGSAVPDGEGAWTTPLTIPAGTPDGPYTVKADCLDEGGMLVFAYAHATGTVRSDHPVPPHPVPPHPDPDNNGGPAQPVTGKPSLTG